MKKDKDEGFKGRRVVTYLYLKAPGRSALQTHCIPQTLNHENSNIWEKNNQQLKLTQRYKLLRARLVSTYLYVCLRITQRAAMFVPIGRNGFLLQLVWYA